MTARSLLLTALAFSTLSAGASAADAHDTRLYLSEGGIDFIAEQVPDYVPSELTPPTFAKSFACMDFEQRDTVINISLDQLDISMPAPGRVQVGIDFSGSMNGELYADNLYACFGEVICQDSLTIDAASALLDYEIMITDGRPQVVSRGVDFSLKPDDVQFELSGCGFTGSALTTAVDFAEGFILNILEDKVADIADENIGPLLEEMLAGLTFEGTIDIAEYTATLQDLDLYNNGLAVRVDANLVDRYAPDNCVAEFDVEEPRDEAGDVPDITGSSASHVNMAANLGLVNKGLYSVWRRGLMCLTDDHLHSLGLEVDLDHIGAILPGFPAGTELSLDIKMARPPRLQGDANNAASMSMLLSGLIVELHGDRPDGTRNTLHVELDVQAAATMGIDPINNAITAKLDRAEITRMLMEDERKATGDGFDVARIQQLVHEHILPSVLDELGTMPLTGPVFSFAGYAVILRDMITTGGYMSAGIDLFRVPENDTAAPDTQILDAPTGITNPHDARVRVSGNDAEIPQELLQYQVTVNGVAQEPSFVREFTVGEAGKSGTYEVQVAAVDLSGNADPSPATVSLEIDGIAPQVNIAGPRQRPADEGAVDLKWTLADDISDAANMKVRVDVFKLEDPKDSLSTVLVESHELGNGATSHTIELNGPKGIYRVEVHAVDEAGNDSSSSLLLSTASTGGCSTGGTGTSGPLSLLLALGALLLRRRRD